MFLLLDEDGGAATRPGARSTSTVHVHGLLAMLPLGLALAERDGRILFMNEAFERAAGIPAGQSVLYPGDLVVKEDKAPVSDAVRRFAAGHRVSGDLAVRLRWRPEEPVALTIAGAKGLGEAAVLLSLKDNSEESKLKKQVLQATKMQAVGQLAGGVAHDFNNILTAIIGHCDLMMMRHAPGDSDYDDIQQIRQNSNRAAEPDAPVARFLAPADAAAATAPAARRDLRSIEPAQAAARRDGDADGQARPQPGAGARRSGAARAGDRQPRGQCARRDAADQAAAR